MLNWKHTAGFHFKYSNLNTEFELKQAGNTNKNQI